MKIVSVIFGLLFALMFSGVGIYIAFETVVPTFQSWQAMQTWESTNATLLNVRGADNDTLAKYRYIVRGKTYENDRVYVAAFRDNIGSYHKNKFKELNQLKHNQQAVGIWYEPDDPRKSIIDRDMRWGLFILMLIFCSVFILIGLLVAYSCLISRSNGVEKKQSLTQLRKKWEEKPKEFSYEESFVEFVNRQQNKQEIKLSRPANAWLEKKEWSENRIHSNSKSSMWATWFFAVLWNAISFPILFFVLEDELKKGNYAVLVALLFPLVGLFLIKKAWDLTREWKRFGVIEFEMDPFPGSIGGHVGGVLHINNIDVLDEKFQIELECVHTYMSGSGKNRSRKENIKWFESGLAKVRSTLDGIELRFRFDVPDKLPEADIQQTGDYNFWRLKVSAKIPGVDLKREYNIPVFQTAAESNHVQHNISAQVEDLKKEKAEEIQSALAQGDLLSTGLARSLRVKEEANKLSFYYPMFRNKFLTFIALIFGGGFGFATYMINESIGDAGYMSIVMLIFSIPFALVSLIGSVAVIYLPFNNLSVSLANRKIKAVRSLIFIPIKRNEVSIDEIKKMEVKSTGSTGQGAAQIKHNKIVVHTNSNDSFTVAEDIDGEELAKQFKDFIYKRLTMS